MRTADFDYNLPEELIAHEPADKRDESRLMVLERRDSSIQHKKFHDVIGFLRPGDLLVLNDTKVIPARLFGEKVGGGAKIEVLLVSRKQSLERGTQEWKCLVKPGKRLKVGTEVVFSDKLRGKTIEVLETGEQIIEFTSHGDFWEVIHEVGEIPLPPYVSKQTADSGKRIAGYQTVYAKKAGASAAPTAGLHFTPELLEKIKAMGVKVAYITLHTGLATFLPVRTDNIEEHKMHSEYYEIPKETVEAIDQAERVIAVGTTVVRALESGGEGGESDLFIFPGYEFKVIDGLITNFHWPKSSLIMLVSAFAGRDYIMKAYQEAIKAKYRFFSFGDAMLIV